MVNAGEDPRVVADEHEVSIEEVWTTARVLVGRASQPQETRVRVSHARPIKPPQRTAISAFDLGGCEALGGGLKSGQNWRI